MCFTYFEHRYVLVPVKDGMRSGFSKCWNPSSVPGFRRNLAGMHNLGISAARNAMPNTQWWQEQPRRCCWRSDSGRRLRSLPESWKKRHWQQQWWLPVSLAWFLFRRRISCPEQAAKGGKEKWAWWRVCVKALTWEEGTRDNNDNQS